MSMRSRWKHDYRLARCNMEGSSEQAITCFQARSLVDPLILKADERAGRARDKGVLYPYLSEVEPWTTIGEQFIRRYRIAMTRKRQ